VYANPEVLQGTEFLRGRHVQTSFIQNLPRASKSFRSYLPLMPLAVEQLDLSAYDLIISSSHAVSKGVLTGPDQLHISYVHSPVRYAWDLQHQYLKESGLDHGIKGLLAKWMLHKIRLWDYRTAAGVDCFVANSKFIGRRIRKVYGRTSDVIYPPVDVGAFDLCETKKDFYLTASRLVPYKRMDLIVQAFALMPEKRLIVIGDGPEMPKLVAASTPNITLLGYQEFSELRRYMQEARAFVFAAEEDFGITPVEAQACGTPVIAFGKGGVLETVVDSEDASLATGIFFPEQTVASLVDAVRRFENQGRVFSALSCRKQAERFSNERFRQEFGDYVSEKFSAFLLSLK
jgi:glycosyltransferase involved in cell wall biosynthesis